MMRVGIVTLPFHFNYGGILQAFALQKAIQNLGFEPIIIEQPSNNIKQVLKQKLYKRSNIYTTISFVSLTLFKISIYSSLDLVTT